MHFYLRKKIKKVKLLLRLFKRRDVKTYGGSGAEASRHLNLSTKRRRVVIFTPFIPKENPLVPIEWEAGWALQSIRMLWKRTKIFFPRRDSNPDSLVDHPVDYSLCRLSYIFEKAKKKTEKHVWNWAYTDAVIFVLASSNPVCKLSPVSKYQTTDYRCEGRTEVKLHS
jgi:hypothetical protein